MSSSSVRQNADEIFGPKFAIDNCYKDVSKQSFVSRQEDFPWFQWMVAEYTKKRKQIKLTEVIITIPRHCCSYNTLGNGTLEEQFEVRAGLDKVDSSFRGQIKKNQACESYRPANPVFVDGEYAKYVFFCNLKQKFIKTTYITVQILGNSSLAISEIDARFIPRNTKAPKRKFCSRKLEKP